MDLIVKQLEPIQIENCECVVWGYRANHSQLYVWLHHQGTSIFSPTYLGFQSVEFFSGPMKWSGASLRNGSREECMKLLDSGFISIPDSAVDAYLDAHRLFIFEMPSYAVRILAAKDVAVIRNKRLRFGISLSQQDSK